MIQLHPHYTSSSTEVLRKHWTGTSFIRHEGCRMEKTQTTSVSHSWPSRMTMRILIVRILKLLFLTTTWSKLQLFIHCLHISVKIGVKTTRKSLGDLEQWKFISCSCQALIASAIVKF